jgi:hypothetical protein
LHSTSSTQYLRVAMGFFFSVLFISWDLAQQLYAIYTYTSSSVSISFLMLLVSKKGSQDSVLLTIWRHGVSSSTNSVYSTTPKFIGFWTSHRYEDNYPELWRSAISLLQPPVQSATATFTADDFVPHFRDKVRAIRSSTANGLPSDIQLRSCPVMASLHPATDDEMQLVLATCPSKSSLLDPLSTWLLKQLTHTITPVFRRMSNLSLQAGVFRPHRLTQLFVHFSKNLISTHTVLAPVPSHI